MPEIATDSRTEDGKQRSLKNLMPPWRRGQSGNKGGVGKRYGERFDALERELEVDGVPLTVRERVSLEMAVRLSLRTPKDGRIAAEAARTVDRLLKPLYARRAKVKAAAAPPLRDRIAEQA